MQALAIAQDRRWLLTAKARLGKPEGKRPLGRTRRRSVDNMKMDLRGTGWDGTERIDRNQWRTPVNTVMNLRVA
jgi:hypothetical protein